MTKKTDLSDLLKTVEAVRKKDYPSVEAKFVSEVVRIEHAAGDDDARALGAIRRLLDSTHPLTKD